MSLSHEDQSDFAGEPIRPKPKPGGSFSLLQLLGVVAILAVLIGLFLPAIRTSRPAARRAQCANNLKQIALGLRAYEARYQSFPPAFTVDTAGKPLHSWRTLILPFLGDEKLYSTIDLTKPWDDPANRKAGETSVPYYICPEQSEVTNQTVYRAVVATGGCFLADRAWRLSEITDDPGLTLMVIEAAGDQAVPWMSPRDADESLVMGLNPRSRLNHSGGTNGAFVNGAVIFLRATIPVEVRRAMISIAGDDDAKAREF